VSGVISPFGQQGAPTLRLVYPDEFGVDPSGTVDSTAGVNRAIAALGTSPGNLVFGVGNYKLAGSLTPLEQNQGIVGQGSAVTEFTSTGNGTVMDLILSGAFTGGQIAGKFTGFTLDGFGAGVSAVGFQQGNLQGVLMEDVTIQGFGGAGLSLANASNQWTEQSNYRVRLIQNKIGCLCDTGSFDYTNLDLMIVANANQSGLQLQNGANFQGQNLRMRGNFAGGATNTGAVIAIAPAGGADTSFIKGTFVDVAVETTGAGTGHFTILNNSTTSASQFFTQGTLFFSNVTIPFQGVSNPHNNPFSHMGIISDTALGVLVNGYGGVVVGGLQQNVFGNLASPLFLSEIFVEGSDIITCQLVNGVNPITFQSTGSYGQRMDLYFAQPASGAAGTATWPGNVKWAGGAAPALSATNGFVDHIRLTYLPAQAAWYGELIGVHYA
jgi:hypothetical protein